MRTEEAPISSGLAQRWIGDGRPLLTACAGALIFSGGFAIFLAVTGDFLPQDVHYLGMTADELCRIECRVVDFMIHDRASFGGALIAIGVLYLWLVTFPLSDGVSWAWWTLALTGTLGFVSFLSYLGYGYLDTWHGIGTLLLLPVFVLGLLRSRKLLSARGDWRKAAIALMSLPRDRVALGRLIILLGAGGTFAAGLVILGIGVSHVFVPEDIHFIGVNAEDLEAISPRLIPLIAHDRAGFGGAVAIAGLTTFLSLVFAPTSRALFQAIAVAGVISLGATFAIHFAVGYQDPWHLTPAIIGLLSLSVGEFLAYPALSGVRAEAGV
jgi:hypothetical protein